MGDDQPVMSKRPTGRLKSRRLQLQAKQGKLLGFAIGRLLRIRAPQESLAITAGLDRRAIKANSITSQLIEVDSVRSQVNAEQTESKGWIVGDRTGLTGAAAIPIIS
jgi:hypothetical protein